MDFFDLVVIVAIIALMARTMRFVVRFASAEAKFRRARKEHKTTLRHVRTAQSVGEWSDSEGNVYDLDEVIGMSIKAGLNLVQAMSERDSIRF